MTARKAASNRDMDGRKIINVGAPTDGSADAVRKTDLETAYTDAISRANHTGSQIASTISDFDTQVRSNRLDQLTAPTVTLGIGGQRLANVADPSSDTDAATRGWVNTQLAGVATGQTLKGTVRAVSTSNVNVASAPAAVDGITPTNGDVFLLAGQSTGAQNGPYTWNGAGSAMTRAANWDAAGEAVVGSYWIVLEGTNADSFALLSNDTFTLATDTAAFVYVSMVTSTATAELDMGNGSATSFPLTHNFGTRRVGVVVYRNASPYDEVDVAIERTDTNTVTIKPDAVWTTDEFHAVCWKL